MDWDVILKQNWPVTTAKDAFPSARGVIDTLTASMTDRMRRIVAVGCIWTRAGSVMAIRTARMGAMRWDAFAKRANIFAGCIPMVRHLQFAYEFLFIII